MRKLSNQTRCDVRYRFSGLVVALVAVMTVLSLVLARAAGQEYASSATPTTLGGCPAESLAFHKCALEKAKTFNPPRTPGGKPDLQGYWWARLTSEYSPENVSATDPAALNTVEPWTISTGMIVDPPDRRIPYQPWATKIGRRGEHRQKYLDPRTMCGPGGVPRMVQHRDAFQIFQPPSEDHVLMLFEDHHAYRIVTMKGRPHVGGNIKLWNGDSRGRWEGNTFVIDVTNVNGYTWLGDAGDFYTDAVHMVERFTMLDPNTIHYEVTLEDPKVYTRPWKMAWALVRETDPSFQIMEEACWEGEHDLPRFRELGYQKYFGATWKSR